MKIMRTDIDKVLGDESRGAMLLGDLLSSPAGPSVLAQYVCFNSPFGACVSHLAGQLAVRRELFRDLSEKITYCQDRSAEVAAPVFAAAIDEFGDTGLPSRPTHRALAQAMLKGIAQIEGYAELNERLSRFDMRVYKKIEQGYGMVPSLSEQQLFNAIGFHIGSELLADGEFRVLDHVLSSKFPALKEHLAFATVDISGATLPTYHWVKIHTTVEIEHLDHAVNSANRALQYYVGTQRKEDVRQQILSGVIAFKKVQQTFIESMG